MQYSELFAILKPEPQSFFDAVEKETLETGYDVSGALLQILGDDNAHFPEVEEATAYLHDKLKIDPEWLGKKVSAIQRACDAGNFETAWKYTDQICRKAKIGTLPDMRSLYRQVAGL